jgi:hypothetical protein
MTSEEAIKYLKKMKDECNDTFHKVRYVTREEALDMAIKALEQEPCEDAVSREEAFEALNSINGTSELDKAFEVIENLPSVTPIHRDRTVQDFVDKCRECGREKVLDKIKAEIERERSFQRAMDEYDIATGLRKALEIIDNYKAEKE